MKLAGGKLLGGAALCVVLSAALAAATTWAPVEKKCPVCGTTDTYQEIASYGTYIYQWPSKYQMIFWPATEGDYVYVCRHCWYAAFMGDFERLPADKVEAVKTILAGNVVDANYQSYAEVPPSVKFPLAVKVYEILGRDDGFWCLFYRIEGYQLSAEGKKEEATAARKLALERAQALLAAEKDPGNRKETLVIIGSMQHFTGDDAVALKTFDEALGAEYTPAGASEEEKANGAQYLDGLANDFKDKIAKGDLTSIEP
jgi:uncharacterized protein (DUF2225 family)